MLQKIINKNLYNKKANISIIEEEKGDKDQIKKTQRMLDELNNKILGKIDIDSIHEFTNALSGIDVIVELNSNEDNFLTFLKASLFIVFTLSGIANSVSCLALG